MCLSLCMMRDANSGAHLTTTIVVWIELQKWSRLLIASFIKIHYMNGFIFNLPITKDDRISC